MDRLDRPVYDSYEGKTLLSERTTQSSECWDPPPFANRSGRNIMTIICAINGYGWECWYRFVRVIDIICKDDNCRNYHLSVRTRVPLKLEESGEQLWLTVLQRWANLLEVMPGRIKFVSWEIY